MSKQIKLTLAIAVIAILGLLGYTLFKSKAGADSYLNQNSGTINNEFSHKYYDIAGDYKVSLGALLFGDDNQGYYGAKVAFEIYDANPYDNLGIKPIISTGNVNTSLNKATYLFDTASRGKKYYYRAIATDVNGNETILTKNLELFSYSNGEYGIFNIPSEKTASSISISEINITPNPVKDGEQVVVKMNLVVNDTSNDFYKAVLKVWREGGGNSFDDLIIVDMSKKAGSTDNMYYGYFSLGTDTGPWTSRVWKTKIQSSSNKGEIISIVGGPDITQNKSTYPSVNISNITVPSGSSYPGEKVVIESDIAVQPDQGGSVSGSLFPPDYVAGASYLLTHMDSKTGTLSGGHYIGEIILPKDAKMGVWKSAVSVTDANGKTIGSNAGPNVTVFPLAPPKVTNPLIINASTITLRGTGAVGNTITVYADDNNDNVIDGRVMRQATVDSSGNWWAKIELKQNADNNFLVTSQDGTRNPDGKINQSAVVDVPTITEKSN